MGRSARLAITLALVAGACVDSTSPESSRRGRYTLARINGDALPVLVVETPVAELYFLRGELMLNNDGSFSDITDMRRQAKPSGTLQFPSDTTRGTYRMVEDTVFLTTTGGAFYRMTFQASGSLVQELVGNTLTYRQ